MKANVKIILCFTILPIVLATGGLSAKQANRVAVKAKADAEYIRARALDASKKVQTYHVVKGKFYNGNTSDKSMEGVTFMEIAENMAANLRRQNYYSEPDPEKGDLIIMINYGATDYDADFMELMNIDSLDDFGVGGSTDTEGLDEFEAEAEFAADFAFMQSINEGRDMSIAFKAKLLGMEELFDDRTTDHQVYQLRDMVSEERYFIYLIAFDLPAYRNGEKKVLWTTRYSMRAIGQPFDEAMGELNYVASNFFGKNIDGLNSRRATDEFEVQVGDIEVIGEESGKDN